MCSASATYAAEFHKNCLQHFNGQTCAITLSGPIVEGDSTTLRALLRLPEHKNAYETGVLHLDSPGGDVFEALKIASLMKEWIGAASVEPKAECASACFVIWIGSPIHTRRKEVDAEAYGKIGLHRPYFSKSTYARGNVEEVAKNQSDVIFQMRKFFQNENLPQRLIDEMMRRASNDIYWLREEDFNEIGVHSPYWEEMSIQRCGNSLKGIDEMRKSTPAGEYVALRLRFLNCVDEMAKSRRPQILRPK